MSIKYFLDESNFLIIIVIAVFNKFDMNKVMAFKFNVNLRVVIIIIR